MKENCLKIMCYISAGIHCLVTLILLILCCIFCVMYDSPEKIIIRFREFNYWIWVAAIVYFLWAFLSSISAISAFAKDRHAQFGAYITNVFLISIFVFIRAVVVIVNEFIDNYSAKAMVIEFFSQVAFCIISAVLVIPCIILHNRLAGYSYWESFTPFCFCCPGKSN